ncbi:MAG: glycosyltransferase [Gammaproteobacteria bacterium]|nr:glycosyltransferase [Gammaproteobacteria bacterium]MBQ0840786.1 glycosyltransferase [Gammaproteobacteria bacterium]
MFRVGKHIPLLVVSPVPWFPFQGLIRYFKPGYRLQPAKFEEQQGVEVYHPRFLAVPGLFRRLDGLSMALCSLFLLLRLKRSFRFTVIDSHFAWPDGYAATLLGRWLGIPVTITMRGTEVPHSKDLVKRAKLLQALDRAARVFAVADSLKRHVVSLGAVAENIQVVGNGVDTERFAPQDRQTARQRFDLPDDAQVLVTVGGLVERKGFHRVIELIPALLEEFPRLYYLVVGGACAEGDWRECLEAQANDLGVRERVLFTGAVAPDELSWPLSAADIFVLPTSNEGWANVFLEAMACGLPVVTSDVGGNPEVVCHDELGTIVPFGHPEALQQAIAQALNNNWQREKIIAYAKDNSWEHRVEHLLTAFAEIEGP